MLHFNDGENVGYISVEPVSKKLRKKKKRPIVNANMIVDPKKGEFEGYDGATKLENNNLQRLMIPWIPSNCNSKKRDIHGQAGSNK